MECFIVDMAACPPGTGKDHHKKMQGLTVSAVLLTHGHFDHIMGLDRFLEEFPVPVYACGAEKELLENAQMNSSAGDARTAVYIYRSTVRQGRRSCCRSRE